MLKCLLRGEICNVINKLEGINNRKISELLIKFLKYIYNDVKLKTTRYKFALINNLDVGRTNIRTKLRFGSRGRILRIKGVRSNINININIIGE